VESHHRPGTFAAVHCLAAQKFCIIPTHRKNILLPLDPETAPVMAGIPAETNFQEHAKMKKSTFERMAEKACWGLEARYGFKKIETKFENRSVIVRFQNNTTEILLNYEIGNTPWLEISAVHDAANKSTLGWLLVEKGVEKAPLPEQAFHPSTLNEGDLEPALQKLGQQLLEYGDDLLKGDFVLMPKLQERARKYALECDRYLSIRKPKP
jgi:hypothetical protein